MISKLSRQHIKVALSGEGGDELMLGYPTYVAHKFANLFNRYLNGSIGVIKDLIDALPASFEYFSLDFRLKQFARGMGLRDPILRHISWMEAFSEHEKNILFAERFGKDGFDNLLEVSDFMKTIIDDLYADGSYREIQYLDIATYLSEDLLVKSDRASMASSLEVRVPYLDHKLVEFIWTLNHRLIFQKRLLKGIMKGVLPRKILLRPKRGFPIPF